MPDLSVIVPTRNRAAHLRRMLEALLGQTLAPERFEVIVVDNGSTDDTSAVAAELQASGHYELRLVREETPGLHRGRHAGMKTARAEILVFADDDIVPSPEWLEAVYDAFRAPGVALVGGKNLPSWEVPPPPWLLQMWESAGRVSLLSISDFGDERREIDPCKVWGCNFSIRKRVLAEARGFHPDGMPPEMLQFRGDGETYVSRFIAASGLRALYEPRAAVRHTVTADRMSMDYFERRAFAEGVSVSFTGLRDRGAARPLIARGAYWLFSLLVRFPVVRRLVRRLFPERLYLRVITGDAFRRGFLWHRRLFAADATLREWVLRADFQD